MATHRIHVAIASPLFRVASIVFFISGATGLAYQVVWFKRFTHVWGSSSLAFAAVGGSFLFGLGLGAYLFGRWADRAVAPLRWYGVCELLIGGLALGIPFEIAALVNASAGWYEGIPEQPLLRYLVQFCITLLVVGPPCVLMGGTLPLLIRQLTHRDGSLDQATGWLYAINTFGGASGCYLTGFHLLPMLGLLWTNNLAASINLAIGLISIVASNAAQRAQPSEAPAGESAAPLPILTWNPRLAALYLAAALSGCAALVLEMTWTRQLALVLGGSTYALTATVFVVLVGIGLGSLIFHLGLRGWASRPILPVLVIGMILAGSLAGVWCLPGLSQWAGIDAVRGLRASQWGNSLICVTASAVVEFLPAVGMGILFPLFVHLTRASAERVGSVVGNIYAWNTLGSIAGASLTAALLFPRIGTAGAVALAAAMYVVSLLAVLPWRGAANLTRVSAAGAVGAAIVLLIAQPADFRLTNLGLYLYGDQFARMPLRQWAARLTPLFFQEGASSNVLVTLHGPDRISMRVNGKIDASNGIDMSTQTGMAYYPRALMPAAKEVLVIGFGSGCTSGRSLLFPGTRVTCCELEPAVYAASECFARFNSSPHKQTRAALVAKNNALPPQQRLTPAEIDRRARFAIVFGDGRTAIQGTSRKYDLVISAPSNPWIAGISNLFTREFFRATRERLNEGGVLAQWIQGYHFTVPDYLMIVRTMRQEFPHYGVVQLAGGTDTLLLASTSPLLPDADGIRRLQEVVDSTSAMRGDLETWQGSGELRWALLANFALGKEQLDRLVDADPSEAINTDLDLRLEFDAPLRLFQATTTGHTVSSEFTRAAENDTSWTERLARSLGLNPDSPEFYVELGDCILRQAANYYVAEGRLNLYYPRKADIYYRRAIALDADCAPAQDGLTRTALWRAMRRTPQTSLEQLVALERDNPAVHALLANRLRRKNDRRAAIEHYRAALQLQPRLSVDSRSWVWAQELAWLLATSPDDELRDGPEAVRWAELARDVALPDDQAASDTLAAALAAAGRFDEAVDVCRQALEMPGVPESAAAIQRRLALYQESLPYREE